MNLQLRQQVPAEFLVSRLDAVGLQAESLGADEFPAAYKVRRESHSCAAHACPRRTH